ncbi:MULTISPECIES: calcium-binding protein [unclassified Streptomyces]|uniref:calcium-binding protein n=1 Tax=unclassified Streptomyces TaxID=2593676 RepID=UPI00381C2BD8
MHTRTRTTAIAVSGVLALSALAVPAAQAATTAPKDIVFGNTKITNLVINNGKPIVLGANGRAWVTVRLTASDPDGISDAGGILYHGADVNHHDGGATILPICGKHTAATYTCVLTDIVDPGKNALAGTWKMWAYANGLNNGHYIQKDPAKTFKVVRASHLTVNAAPEPVKKGKTLTVTGALTLANWQTHKYAGYGKQKVVLQFRKAGTPNFVNVRTITASSTGALRTTVKAAADGYWRYAYAGSSTTGSSFASADYVDVK